MTDTPDNPEGLVFAPTTAAPPSDDGSDNPEGLVFTPAPSKPAAQPVNTPTHGHAHKVQATAPAPDGGEPDWANMPVTEVARRAAPNVLPSAVQVLKDTGNAVMHPLDTGKALLSVGKGALGIGSSPQDQAAYEAFKKHYTDTYGSGWGGFAKSVVQDPASVGMDLSVPLTLGSSVLGEGAGVAGRIGKVASVAGKALDPVQGAIALAKKPIQAADYLVRGSQAIASGVSPDLLKLARQAGSSTDPAVHNAFMSHFMGNGDPYVAAQTAQNALKNIKNQVSQDYLTTKAGITAATQPLPFNQIDTAFNAARARTSYLGATSGFKPANDALDAAEQIVNDYRAGPRNNIEGLDNLKQAIWDLRDQQGNQAARTALDGVYNSVRQTLVDADPSYAKLMEQYQDGLNTITTLTKQFGLQRPQDAAGFMIKALRNARMGRGNLLDQLAATPDGKYLPYMLAGAAMRPLAPDGLRKLLEYHAAFSDVLHDPMSVAGQFVASSPKANGLAQYGAGALLNPAISPLPRLASRPVRYAAERYAMSGAPQSPATPASGDDYDHMLNIESGGHQLNAQGQPLISPAGAVGKAQVMPATGPEAAQLAGVPWDPRRFYSDSAYNENLGRAYYQQQLAHFGDPDKAAAAYNAGPTRVAQAVDHARRYGGDWRDYIPHETQQYLAKLQRLRGPQVAATGGRIERRAGGKVQLDHGGEADRLIRAAEASRRNEGKATEALLDVPDETIVAALADAKGAL